MAHIRDGEVDGRGRIIMKCNRCKKKFDGQYYNIEIRKVVIDTQVIQYGSVSDSSHFLCKECAIKYIEENETNKNNRR